MKHNGTTCSLMVLLTLTLTLGASAQPSYTHLRLSNGTNPVGIGDFNGDGFEDLATVGDGNTYIYLGFDGFDVLTDLTIAETPAAVVSGLGDVNGDGFDDIIVGINAPTRDSERDPGEARVYLGSATPDATPDLFLTAGLAGEFTADEFGASVATAGDINADGFNDIIVSAPGPWEVSELCGRVYVYMGSATLGTDPSPAPDQTLMRPMPCTDRPGHFAGSGFGQHIASAGDFNGDGFDDVTILTSFDESKRAVYFSDGTRLVNNPFGLDSPAIGFHDLPYGSYNLSHADVNNDGFSDVLGVEWTSRPANEEGFLNNNLDGIIHFGGNPPGAATDLVFPQPYEGDLHPLDANNGAISTARDVNSDGFDDIIVGWIRAPRLAIMDDGPPYAHIFFGGDPMDTTADVILRPGSPLNPNFAETVSVADVNADGCPDLLVAPNDVFLCRTGLIAQPPDLCNRPNGPPQPFWLPPVNGFISIHFPCGIRRIEFYDVRDFLFPGIFNPNFEDITQQFVVDTDYEGCPGGQGSCVSYTYQGDPTQVPFELRVQADLLAETGAFSLNLYDVNGQLTVYAATLLDENGFVDEEPEPPSPSYDIYTVDAATGAIERVTDIPNRSETAADWSPDGRYMVYDVALVGSDGIIVQQHLSITDLATGIHARVPGSDGGNNAKFSPDGRQLLFDRCPGGAGPICEFSVYTLPVTGGTPTLVRRDAVLPDWSPNGQAIVFRQPSDETIRTMHLRSGHDFVLSPRGRHPAWSNKGKYILHPYVGPGLYRTRVSRVGKPLRSPERITFTPGGETLGTWAPDDESIAFNVFIAGTFEVDLYMQQLGGEPKLLVSNTGPGCSAIDPDWAPTGTLIAYSACTDASVAPAKMVSSQIPAKADKQAQQTTLEASSYPNPFNPTGTIRFSLPEASDATLIIYDVLGREVATLINGPMEAGTHAVRFDAGHLPSGAYFYRIQAGNERLLKQFILMK